MGAFWTTNATVKMCRCEGTCDGVECGARPALNGTNYPWIGRWALGPLKSPPKKPDWREGLERAGVMEKRGGQFQFRGRDRR